MQHIYNKSKKLPLVSIIMTCFNGEEFLEKAIKSILNQTYSNWELIFFDNNSNDNSKKILEKFKDKRIKYFKNNKKTNLGEVRELSYNKCNGDFISFLDVDDTWVKNKLTEQVKVFFNPNIDLVFTNCFILEERNMNNKNLYLRHNKIFNKKLYLEDILKSYYVDNPLTVWITLMIRSSILKQMNYVFNKKYHIISDFDLVMRLAEKNKILGINKPLATYRMHNNNESYLRKKDQLIELKKWTNTNKKKEIYLQSLVFKKFIDKVNYDLIKIKIINNNYKNLFKSILNLRFILNKIKILIVAIMLILNFKKFN
jgi:glycosyltransferase involved in cell wall biosynthesis